MGISDDRWTCPDCNWTYALGESRADARTRLSAARDEHAKEHANARVAPRSVFKRESTPALPKRLTSHLGEAV